MSYLWRILTAMRMTIKEFFSFKTNKYFWVNIIAMIVVMVVMIFGVLKWLDIHLELKPGAGEKVKEGRTVYLTVNTLDVPLRAIPDVADNSSLRQAQAKLLNAGFKLNQIQLVNGEKDWVYGVKYQGRQLAAGEKIPLGASLTLMVGDGSGDMSEEEDSVDVSVDTEKPVTSESSPAQDDSWF